MFYGILPLRDRNWCQLKEALSKGKKFVEIIGCLLYSMERIGPAFNKKLIGVDRLCFDFQQTTERKVKTCFYPISLEFDQNLLQILETVTWQMPEVGAPSS